MTTTPASNKLRLSDAVFFKKIGAEVYVRNVTTGEEFLFSEDAAPVFASLRRGISVKSRMPVAWHAFLRELESFGLLELSSAGAESVSGRVIGESVERRIDIASRMQDESARLGRLWTAGLELTWRCNARCRHCYLDVADEQTAGNELSRDEWLSVVGQLARMGCMNVLVTGGEPSLHHAFVDVCREVVRRGMLCDVYTNGIELPDSVFDALCDLPLNSVSVSLYSGTAAFHDSVTGIPGSFHRTLSNLLRLKAAGCRVYAKTPLFHGHLEDWFSAKRLGERHGFRVSPATILVPGHSGSTRNGLMLDAGEYRAFLERETTPDPDLCVHAAGAVLPDSPVCQAGRTTLCVSPFGAVRPCNSFPLDCGSVRSASLASIWKNSPQLRSLRALRRRDLDARCATCPDIACCTVCPGASWSESGRFVPCSWSCAQASVRASFNRSSDLNR